MRLMACISMFLTLSGVECCCARATKSSTKTSMYPRKECKVGKLGSRVTGIGSRCWLGLFGDVGLAGTEVAGELVSIVAANVDNG